MGQIVWVLWKIREGKFHLKIETFLMRVFLPYGNRNPYCLSFLREFGNNIFYMKCPNNYTFKGH